MKPTLTIFTICFAAALSLSAFAGEPTNDDRTASADTSAKTKSLHKDNLVASVNINTKPRSNEELTEYADDSLGDKILSRIRNAINEEE